MTRNSIFNIRHTKYWLPAILLAVLVMGLMPLPAKAAVSVDFDVNPKGEVDPGSKELTLEADVTVISPGMCPRVEYRAGNLTYVMGPKVLIVRSTGTTRPTLSDIPFASEPVIYREDIDKNGPETQLFDWKRNETFQANPPGTIIHFRAFVVCEGLNITALFGNISRDILTASGEVTILTKGAQFNGFSGGEGTSLTLKGLVGGGLLSVINVIIGYIVSIARWIVYALGLIFVALLEVVLSIRAAEITGFIVGGWTTVRDLVNMFFIIILIIIGFGTMLRIESYSYKKLLVNLIVMAMLVNFSLVIGRIIIQIADVAQFTFLPNGSEGIDGVKELFKNLSSAHISNILAGWRSFSLSGSAALGSTFAIIFQFILELAVMLTFAALAIFLLIRVLALWILLIISPFAYALAVLPTTSGLARKWWSTFMKYVFFTPIIAFFLRLTQGLYRNGLKIFPEGSLFDPGSRIDLVDYMNQVARGGERFTGGDIKSTMILGITFFVVLAFLWAGMIITKEMGIAGAGAIVGLAERGLKAPFAAGWKGTKFAAGGLTGLVGRSYSRYMNRKMTAAEAAGQTRRANVYKALQFLNPRVAGEAWKARREEKEKEAYLPAVGHVRDTLNRVMPTEWHRDKEGKWHLGQKSYYGRIGQRGLINHKMKDWQEANLSEEEKVAAYYGATHPEDLEALNTILLLGRHEDGRAILGALEKRKKREEELVAEYIKQGESQEVARIKAGDQAEKEIPAYYSPVEDLEAETERLKAAGLTNEQIGQIQAHKAEIAEAERKLRGLGVAVHEFDGNFRAANDFSGYEKLAKAKGNTAMLKELASTGVFGVRTKTVLDQAGKELIGADGKPIQVPVELDFKGHKITDYQSFMKAVEDTKGKTVEEKEQLIKGREHLRHELTGKRMQLSAQKRIERGDTELWGAAWEPAAFMRQHADGRFTWDDAYGREIFKNMPNPTINAFKRSRRLQARVEKIEGLYKDKRTGLISVDPQFTDYKVMVESYVMNPDAARAVIDRADLSVENRDKVAQYLQAEFEKQGYVGKILTIAKTQTAGETIEVDIERKGSVPGHMSVGPAPRSTGGGGGGGRP